MTVSKEDAVLDEDYQRPKFGFILFPDQPYRIFPK